MQSPSQSIWPNNAPFALFLSHDVDQIHDREVFHFLATVNHIRRMLTQGEPGNVKLALKRLARMLFTPKQPMRDFETILAIEARHGFRSTFYVLDDPYWSRNGARYRLHDGALRRIVKLMLDARCEMGLHGGVKCFNNAERYRESKEAVCKALNVDVVGIRNHLLKFSEPETWQAQEDAGFLYDATYGHADSIGLKGDNFFPFHPFNPRTGKEMKLVELPLTVMDGALFRGMRLRGQAALDAAWDAITPVIEKGGLVSLLWHNNYFNEPEYWDWQWVYEQLLERLAALDPWCATGAEIAEWWRARSTGEGDEDRSPRTEVR